MDKIQCYRDQNNFGYTYGSISFKRGSRNNVVISDRKKTEVKNLKDSLLIIQGNSEIIFPLINLEEAARMAKQLTRGLTPQYHRPEKVKIKEDLSQKDLGSLSKIIYSHYDINPKQIRRISRTGRGEGIFYLSTEDKKEYILKHYDDTDTKLNLLGHLTNISRGIFPRILPSKSGSYSLEMEDGYYGLEEFIKGEIIDRNLDYFFKVGREMGFMHESMNKLLGQSPILRNSLHSDEGSLSESNMLSLWIELGLANLTKERNEVSRVFRASLTKKIQESPESFIHADLNNANILWLKGKPYFIDVETSRYSRRILDFEGTLLFRGNMLPPEYIPGSAQCLIKGYNSSVKVPINEQERGLMSDLMIYSVLKNFVIRNIRRGQKENSLERLRKNILRINMDFLGL